MVEITEYRNAIARTEDGLIVDLEILHPQFGWLPYTITPDDPDSTIDNEALLELIGDDISAYTPPTQSELDAIAADVARQNRADLLSEVDAIAGNALRWADLTPDQQAEWAVYRQALLNITDQEGFPQNITWPNKPE